MADIAYDNIATLYEALSGGFQAKPGPRTVEQVQVEADRIKVEETDGGLKVGRLQIHSVSDAAIAPNRAYIVKGLFYEGEFSAIYGPPGCGKSFVGAHLGYAVSQGRPVLGKRVRQAVVLYAFLEGEGGATKRIKALQQEFGHSDTFRYIAQPVNLHDDAEAMLELIAAAKAIDAKWIIIDTLNRAMGGGDENSADGMGKILSVFSQIRHATGAHVTVVHHTGKDTARGMRGHSSLHGACDGELEVSRTDTGPRLLRFAKAKDDADGQKLGFELARVVLGIDEDGDEISTCLVAEADAPKPGARPLTGQAKQVYDVLVDTLNVSGRAGPTGHAHIPNGVTVVQASAWREAAYGRVFPDDATKTREAGFRRARDRIFQEKRAAAWGDWVWAITENDK